MHKKRFFSNLTYLIQKGHQLLITIADTRKRQTFPSQFNSQLQV